MSLRPQHHINDQLAQKGPMGGAHPRSGIVSAVEVVDGKPTGRVRVRFKDRSNLESYWLHVVVQNSQNNKRYHGPDVDEQVACVMDAYDEEGFVIGAIFSAVDAPAGGTTTDDDSMTYKDGTVIGYNRATHTVTINIPIPNDGVVNVIVVNGVVNVEAPQVKVVSPDVRLGETPIETVVLDSMIAIYNGHTHNYHPGGGDLTPTAAPTQQGTKGVNSAPHVTAL